MTGPNAERERRRVELGEPRHGWDHPWPNAFEVAAAFDTSKWSLVGGLMVQAHAIGHGITIVRPTSDLDVLLHVEVSTGVAGAAHDALARMVTRSKSHSTGTARTTAICAATGRCWTPLT